MVYFPQAKASLTSSRPHGASDDLSAYVPGDEGQLFGALPAHHTSSWLRLFVPHENLTWPRQSSCAAGPTPYHLGDQDGL